VLLGVTIILLIDPIRPIESPEEPKKAEKNPKLGNHGPSACGIEAATGRRQSRPPDL
jgi:hypothetical protein